MGFCSTTQRIVTLVAAAQQPSSLAAVAGAGAGAMDIGDGALELGRHSVVLGVSGVAHSTLCAPRLAQA
jgi:hypothetical protein